MKIYSWKSDSDNYATISGRSMGDGEALHFDYYLDEIKEPVCLKAIYDDRGELPLSDSPYTGTVFPKCMSSRAFSILGGYLKSTGEIRAADIDGTPYFLFWPTVVVDCLDIIKSEIHEFASGYRRLVKPVFCESRVPEKNVFLIPQFKRQFVFVSKEFKQVLDKSALSGLILNKV